LNSPVFTSLIPVILFIAIGFYVGRRGWIRAPAVKDLANLVFMVLTPALLFRTMSTVHIEDLNFGPVGIYFVAFGVVYAATLAVLGFSSLGAARALANTFSNTLMIGVPLVGLVFGEQIDDGDVDVAIWIHPEERKKGFGLAALKESRRELAAFFPGKHVIVRAPLSGSK
jgi:asparagine N-glycosylation enzyme membrane subunit Stt3